MIFLIGWLLAALGLAFAAPPARATYCSEDNLLRAFQHTPTPASLYCITAITATAYPTFLAVKSYPPSRLGSACSCFSRFPTEGVAASTPTTTASPTLSCDPSTATLFEYKGSSQLYNYDIDLLFTINRGVACGSLSSYRIDNICGIFRGGSISYDRNVQFANPSYCFYPLSRFSLDRGGVDFIADVGGQTTFYFDGIEFYLYGDTSNSDLYTGNFVIPCVGSTATCPLPTV